MGADLALKSFAVARWLAQSSAREIIEPFKFAAHADRPVHRAYVQRECVGNFVDGFECRAAFAVDLVYKCNDGHRTQATHFE